MNSAAVFPEDTLLGLTADRWAQTMAVNLTAPVFLTQAFAGALSPDMSGVVVNMTDWRTMRPYPDHFSYTVSKGGLDAFTRAAAIALAPRIRVNAVALGAIIPPAGKDSTYLKALAAKDNDVPFYVALPHSTIDWTLSEGLSIPIEERSSDEVLKMPGRLADGTVVTVEIAAPGSPAGNPAFDVTPHRYIAGIITERGIFRPPYAESLRLAFEATAAKAH